MQAEAMNVAAEDLRSGDTLAMGRRNVTVTRVESYTGPHTNIGAFAVARFPSSLAGHSESGITLFHGDRFDVIRFL